MKNATLIGLLSLFATAAYADVTRHPLPGGSTFPIAQAVEVSAGTTLVYHSGTLPPIRTPNRAAVSTGATPRLRPTACSRECRNHWKISAWALATSSR